jgi:PBP1b-binding outer membrane lipoprotein LpoB
MNTNHLLFALVLIGALLVVSCSSEDAPATSVSLISI